MARRPLLLVVSPVVLAVALAATALSAQPARTPAPAFTAADLMASVKTLTGPDMAGRRVGTPGNAAARAWIVSQFEAARLQPVAKTFELPFIFQRRQPGGDSGARMTGTNVAGRCPGSDASGDRAIVVSAHYDHLGERDGAIYHGADDNASGVAVLTALTRQCRTSPWVHDVIFVAFDAEEMGLQGARAFVANPPLGNEEIAVNVNLDMVARGDKGEIYIAGTSHWPELRPVLEPVAARSAITVRFGHDSGGGRNDWTTQSDHGAFHAAGIPFVYFGVEDHPDYHKPTDTADRIDARFFYRAALTILDAVTAIDRGLPLSPK